jgi:hypothetical protein
MKINAICHSNNAQGSALAIKGSRSVVEVILTVSSVAQPANA